MMKQGWGRARNEHFEGNFTVAFFIGHFPVVSESWFIDQVVSLIDLGVNIHIFAFHRGDIKEIPEIVKSYGLMKRVTYLDAPPSFFGRLIITPYLLLRLLFHCPSALFRVFLPDNEHNLSLQYLFWTAPLLGKINGFAIAHCHFGMTANRYLIIKKILRLKQPIVTTFYGQDSSKYINAKGSSVYNELKKEGEYLLVMTEEMKERMIRFGFPEDRVQVHYTGIIPENFEFTQRKYISKEIFKIVFLGRFVEKKGVTDLLRAVGVVVKTHSNVELHIIGGGNDIEYNKEIQKTLLENKLEQRVVFHGIIPNSELSNTFKNMHLMVHLAKTAKNGDTDDLPVAILDGQASGIPVITTRHVGIPDGILDGETGYLVDEGDYRAAADKIIYLMEHPDVLSMMSIRAREFVSERFDIIGLDKQLLGLYAKILGREKNKK